MNFFVKATALLLLSGASFALSSTSNLQEAQIGELATSYFKAHPEKMLEIMQSMQQALKAQQFNGVKRILVKNRAFLADSRLPSLGNPNATKTLVFFFDYQCIYCHKQYPLFKKLIDHNKDVKVVFMPLHLFGEASLYASKMALYFTQLGRFAEFNSALEKANLIEGQLDDAAVRKIAKSLGVDLSKANKFIESTSTQALIAKIDALQSRLGIQATPMMFSLPLNKKTLSVNDVRFIQGYVSLSQLNTIV